MAHFFPFHSDASYKTSFGNMYSNSSDPNKNLKILKSVFNQGKVGIRSGDWNVKRCLVVSIPAKELSGPLTG